MTSIPIISIEQAWLNLASDILQLAIKDIRLERDPRKRERTKRWLLSPAAKLLFDSLLSNLDIDIKDWVLAGCPEFGKNDRRH